MSEFKSWGGGVCVCVYVFVCVSVIGSMKYDKYLKESLNRAEICIIIQARFIKSLVVRFGLGVGYKGA